MGGVVDFVADTVSGAVEAVADVVSDVAEIVGDNLPIIATATAAYLTGGTSLIGTAVGAATGNPTLGTLANLAYGAYDGGAFSGGDGGGLSGDSLFDSGGGDGFIEAAGDGGSGNVYEGLNYSDADIEALNAGTYSGPEGVGQFPSTQPVNYGMTPTGTPPGGLTPTGGGVGLTQTAPSGAAITGGVAGAAGSAAVPGTVATGANAAVGGITGSGTSVFDTFLDKLSNNPIQTAIKAAQVVSGITSGVNAVNAPISPTAAQKMADPFASSRQQYIDKLNALMANPSMVMSQPGYQFALQQGMQGLNRNLSKSGMGTSTPGFPGTPASGAAGIAQQNYGQNFALKSYDDYVNQLSGLSGATQKPSAGYDAFMGAQRAASDAANSGYKSIAQASGGLLDLFGRSPQTGSTTNAPPVGGGTAAGGGNFSPAIWNDPNWFLNSAPSGYSESGYSAAPVVDYVPDYTTNYSDVFNGYGSDVDFTDYF